MARFPASTDVLHRLTESLTAGYLGKNPWATDSLFVASCIGLRRAGPQPRSRRRTRPTNAVDRGEDQHMLLAAEEGGGEAQFTGGSRLGWLKRPPRPGHRPRTATGGFWADRKDRHGHHRVPRGRPRPAVTA